MSSTVNAKNIVGNSGVGSATTSVSLTSVVANRGGLKALLADKIEFETDNDDIGRENVSKYTPIQEQSEGTLKKNSNIFPAVNITSNKKGPDSISINNPNPTNGVVKHETSRADNVSQWPAVYRKRAGVGLNNLGNTCFLNATLQALVHTPPLITSLLINKVHDTNNCARQRKTGFCMLCAMRGLLSKCLDSQHRSYTPSYIVDNLRLIARHLRQGRQEDAHEFLRFAVESMHQSTLAGKPPKTQAKKESTLIHKIFGGRLRSRVMCMKCHHPSDTFDTLLDLSVDVAKCNSLKKALSKFVEPDHLTGSNKYKCEKCKKLVNATKEFTVDRAPSVLTIHLKRFTPTGKKINENIYYDEMLNLGPFMSRGEANYRLYAVVCHQGSGPYCGHYYSYVRGGDDTWREMDDSHTRVMRGDGGNVFQSKYAYVLFYARVDGSDVEFKESRTVEEKFEEEEEVGDEDDAGVEVDENSNNRSISKKLSRKERRKRKRELLETYQEHQQHQPQQQKRKDNDVQQSPSFKDRNGFKKQKFSHHHHSHSNNHQKKMFSMRPAVIRG